MRILLMVALFWLMSSPSMAAEPTDYVIKHEQMLYNVVLVQAGRGSGSGTVIYSGEQDGEIHTYILTNWHVISSAISINKEWNSKLAEEVDVEQREPVEAYWFDYIRYAVNTGKRGQRADIVAYNEKMDLALIRLVDNERVVSIAPLIPPDDEVHLMERVWAIGSGLGHPPFATSGFIASIDGIKSGRNYMMTTAPIVWGNSGGALFRWSDERERYELIGVPSRISVMGYSTPIFNMAWSIPAKTIYEFLDANCFDFITGNDIVDECKDDDEDDDEDE